MKEVLPFFIESISGLMHEFGYIKKDNNFIKIVDGFRLAASCGEKRAKFAEVQGLLEVVPEYVVVGIQFDVSNHALHDHLKLGWRSSNEFADSGFWFFAFNSKFYLKHILRNKDDVSRCLPEMLEYLRSDSLLKADRLLSTETLINRVVGAFEGTLKDTGVRMKMMGIYLMCKRGNFATARNYMQICRAQTAEKYLNPVIDETTGDEQWRVEYLPQIRHHYAVTYNTQMDIYKTISKVIEDEFGVRL